LTNATTPVPAQREPELAGQTVVVIGGSSGIGLETARRARAEGADVILTGRNPDRLEQAAAELGVQRTAAFDASDAASLARFFQDLPAPIDHVMVTAGGPLLFMGDAGGRRVGRGLGIAAAVTATLPPFTAALALELAPVRVKPPCLEDQLRTAA
jgi:NAD(P)-dependent dehydrogenase (short-subunit alcohol dehydrogenase family)